MAGLAGCAAYVDRRASEREAAAERGWPPEGQILDIAGREVHAVVTGAGPDVVLIHGASGSTRDFTFGFADLLARDYRVIVLDRPGLGYSGRLAEVYERPFAGAAESPAEQAAILRAAALQLGAEQPIVLGHSYGGAVALAWALDHPEGLAGVVNLSGASMPWPGGLGALYSITGTSVGGAIVPPLITAFAPGRSMEDTIAAVFAPNPAPEGYAEHFGPLLSLRRETLRANARQVNGLRPHIVEMSERYGEITVPVEIVHGARDTIVPPAIHSERLVELIPGAQLTILADVGHMPHHIAPAEVIAAVDRIAERAGLR